MMDLDKHGLLLCMIERLRAHGGRTGKTHVIKGLFLGQAAGMLNVPFHFFLYKHGPYSAEIEANLDEMKSYGAIASEPAHDGYGVILEPDENADFVRENSELSREQEDAITCICKFIAGRNVGELERLATAAWIRTQEAVEDAEDVAKRLNELKPHVSLAEARQADRTLERFLRAE